MREAISKKIRFEVFKRDSFKCQYCGESAPDVTLHLDHIHPIAEGGDNSITNLITSCQPCNLGKGARTLSDSSTVEKQKQQLDELNERRNQLEMMMNWRKELTALTETTFDHVYSHYKSFFNFSLTESGQNDLRKWIKRYPVDTLLDSIEAAAAQYLEYDSEGSITLKSADYAFGMIPRICTKKQKELENPQLKDFYYIRGILKNRFSNWYADLNWKIINLLQLAFDEGVDTETLKDIAKEATNWTNFRQYIQDAIERD